MQLTSQGSNRFLCSRAVKCQWKSLWEAEVGMEGRCAGVQTLIYSIGNNLQTKIYRFWKDRKIARKGALIHNLEKWSKNKWLREL